MFGVKKTVATLVDDLLELVTLLEGLAEKHRLEGDAKAKSAAEMKAMSDWHYDQHAEATRVSVELRKVLKKPEPKNGKAAKPTPTIIVGDLEKKETPPSDSK